MIDIKQLRENPDRFKRGAELKNYDVDIDRLLALDARLLDAQRQQQELRTEQNAAGKTIAKLAGEEKKQAIDAMAALKQRAKELDEQIEQLQPDYQQLLDGVPLPPDEDVPQGASAEENVQLSTWNPEWFDLARSFEDNRGFAPKSHIELGESLGLVDFPRGVKMAGTRSYVLTGAGMLLQQAVLRMGFDYMVHEQGFTPISVPVIVREEMLYGTGFFPFGRDQVYWVEETQRGAGQDLYLTGTGEVGLMGLHQGEILEEDQLPRRYVTWSTCFRREAGAAGKDTAGLFRIHQFDKVEQVVLCPADEEASRQWHKKMIGFVETLMQKLELPYRLLQCCTGDLGPKNADMIDIEAWMPSRGEVDAQGRPSGDYGETHSASRLYDYQCRRLNLRYRPNDGGGPVVCHSLNNTVFASPRVLIPIIEMYQNQDGTVTVPQALRPYMGGIEKIEPPKQ